jgi:DNA-binding protein HU-beta
MNKGDLIDVVAKTTCSKAEAGKAVDAFIEAVKKALKKGEKVTIVGFGTFSVAKGKSMRSSTRSTHPMGSISHPNPHGFVHPILEFADYIKSWEKEIFLRKDQTVVDGGFRQCRMGIDTDTNSDF